MSFETFLDRWTADPKAVKQELVPYRVQMSNALSECEILHRGVQALDSTHFEENQICWLRDASNKLKCCYYMGGVFHEFTYKQLDVLFGQRIRDSQYCLENNKRILPNGIYVPVVPPEFITQVVGKDASRKRRKIEQARIKKTQMDQVNAILWFFYVDSAPTIEECYTSIYSTPPRIFARDESTLPKSPNGTVQYPTEETVELENRASILNVLKRTRDTIKKHPLYAKQLQTCCLSTVRTMDDLVNLSVTKTDGTVVKIGSEIISVYDFLFPG